MSWSLQVKPRTAPSIFGAIDAAQPSHDLSDESTEQLRTAKIAAKAIVESQVVGGTDKAFGVTLSGHANPGHEPVDGSANDEVTVRVTQADEEDED